jgi:hypothetical protein
VQKHGIASRTPLPGFTAETKILRGCLEVQDNDKHIRAILMNHDIVPSHKLKDNRILIINLAARLKRKIVFIKADGTYHSPEENETAKQKKEDSEKIAVAKKPSPERG